MATVARETTPRRPGTPRLPPFALVIPIAFIQLAFTFPIAGMQDPAGGEVDKLGFGSTVLLLAGPALLLGRRRWPLLTLFWTVVVTLVYLLLRFPLGPVYLSPVVASFTAVLLGPRLFAWLGTSVAYATVVTVTALVSPHYEADLGGVAFGVAWMTLILGTAEIVKARRERAAQTQLTREEQGLRKASEERLKIAREVHDVLAHHVSLINVQSGVALHLMDEEPEQARQALSAIKQSSKEVLVELRGILGVLRDVDGSAPRQPVASLDQLDRLLERMREAGLPVTLERTGAVRPLPTGVDTAALRIVQESLTNTYRHAGSTNATVRLDYGSDELRIEVLDQGRGELSGFVEGTGSGLTGMRQRAEALGGTLSAGPRPGGGFRVAATLPTGRTETEDGS